MEMHVKAKQQFCGEAHSESSFVVAWQQHKNDEFLFY
jgi:hypothetical protein